MNKAFFIKISRIISPVFLLLCIFVLSVYGNDISEINICSNSVYINNETGNIQDRSNELVIQNNIHDTLPIVIENNYALHIHKGVTIEAPEITIRVLNSLELTKVKIDGTLITDKLTIECGELSVSGKIQDSKTIKQAKEFKVLADYIRLEEFSQIEINNFRQKGELLLGTFNEKLKKETKSAKEIYIAQSASINVFGQFPESEERVIIWSTKKTEMHGTISASSIKGKGGFIEVSSEKEWIFPNWISAADVSGTEKGSFLIDPNDITITNSSGSPIASSTTNSNTLTDADISNYLQNNGNLTIQTTGSGGNGNITFDNNTEISWASSYNLELIADRAIIMNPINCSSKITSVSGNISLTANASGTSTTSTDGEYAIRLWSTTITTTSGAITINGKGLDDASTYRHVGVYLANAKITSTGTGASVGKISIIGEGGLSSATSRGVSLMGSGSVVSSVDADIEITGNSGASGSLGDTDDGVEIASRAKVKTTGTGANAGNILINGTSNTTLNKGSGMKLFNYSEISTIDGNIEINCKTSSNKSSSYGINIVSS